MRDDVLQEKLQTEFFLFEYTANADECKQNNLQIGAFLTIYPRLNSRKNQLCKNVHFILLETLDWIFNIAMLLKCKTTEYLHSMFSLIQIHHILHDVMNQIFWCFLLMYSLIYFIKYFVKDHKNEICQWWCKIQLIKQDTM